MKQISQQVSYSHSRRKFLKNGLIGLSAYSALGTASNTSEHDYDIIEQQISIPNLPNAFKGFTIGMISDIHSSVFMDKEDMLKYVHAVNELKTDLVVVTGDFVNSQTEEVYPFAEAFSELKAPFGVFGCLGNHDFFADNVEKVAQEVNDCGVKLLRNDVLQIFKEDSFFNLIGVDDIGRGVEPEVYIGKAVSSIKNEQPRILLCHKPYFMETYNNFSIDLTLSGHTHGGQIVFARIGNTVIAPATLFSKYVAGLYTQKNTQLYVNKGLGSVGLPFRINCPPEITKITLL